MQRLYLILIAASLLITGVALANDLDSTPTKRDIVPDMSTALRIAEAVFDARFGETTRRKFEPYKGYEVETFWIVAGTSTEGLVLGGGMPTVEISKEDGRIIKLYLSR
jgi:hypothetical protein